MANCDAFTSLSRQSCDTPPPLPPPPEIALDSPFIGKDDKIIFNYFIINDYTKINYLVK